MYEPHNPNRERVKSPSILVRPADPVASTNAWEVVRDGEVVHAATSEAGAMDFAHGLVGSPLPPRRR